MALSTVIVDQIVARFTYTPSLNPIFIDSTNGCTNSIATLPAYFFVSIFTDTTLIFLIIDLSFRITDTTNSSHQIVTRQTSAGSDCRIPNFISFTGCVTDTIDLIVHLSRRTNTTRIPNQIIASSTLTSSIHPFFIPITGRGTKAKV